MKTLKLIYKIPYLVYVHILLLIASARIKSKNKKWLDYYDKNKKCKLELQWVNALKSLSGYNLISVGNENIGSLKNTFIMANHISNWDPIILTSKLNMCPLWIGKKEIVDNPILNPLDTVFNGAWIDRKDPKQTAISLMNVARKFKSNEPLALFVQGTRSEIDAPLPPKKDIIRFAKSLKADILPIRLSYNRRWFRTNNDFTIEVKNKLYYDQVKNLSVEQIADKINNLIIKK